MLKRQTPSGYGAAKDGRRLIGHEDMTFDMTRWISPGDSLKESILFRLRQTWACTPWGTDLFTRQVAYRN